MNPTSEDMLVSLPALIDVNMYSVNRAESKLGHLERLPHLTLWGSSAFITFTNDLLFEEGSSLCGFTYVKA